MTVTEQVLQLKKDFDDVYEAGKKNAGGNASNPFEYATQISNLYNATTFPSDTEITIVAPLVTNLNYFCYMAKNLKKVTIKGNVGNIKMDGQQAFRENLALECVDFSGLNAKFSTAYQIFYKCSALKEIKGEFDFSECTNVNNTFAQCPLLEEVRLKPNTLSLSITFLHSPNLSTTSIQSIIDGLATVGTTQTLTLNSKSTVTTEQKSIIESKGWKLTQ